MSPNETTTKSVLSFDSTIEELRTKVLLPYSLVFQGKQPLQPVPNRLAGIVYEKQPTKATKRGRDAFSTTIVLREPTADNTISTAKMTIFHGEHNSPLRWKPGDIFLCQDYMSNAQFKNFNVTRSSEWAAFDNETGDKLCEGTQALQWDDDWAAILSFYQQYAITETSTTRTTTFTHGTGARYILPTKDLKEKAFVDYVGMVVHAFRVENRDKVALKNLLLTDYTVNPRPLNSNNIENAFKVNSQLLIHCTLYDENATNCPDLVGGNFVYIKNALSKTHKMNGCLELAVRHDRNARTEKVRILDKDDPLVTEIRRRKFDYESSKSQEWYQNVNKERNNDDDTKDASNSDGERVYKKMKMSSIETIYKYQSGKVKEIRDILHGDLNKRYHINASVIDYRPKEITKICLKYCSPCNETSDINTDACQYCNNDELSVIYRCSLLLKDLTGLKLYAAMYGTSQEPMFENVPVVDLQTNEDAYGRVVAYMNAVCPPGKEGGPLFNFCIQPFMDGDMVRCIITDTRFSLME